MNAVAKSPLVYLHIGFNKAASTTLQEQIFARHPQIAYLGRPYKGLEGNDGIDRTVLEKAVRAIRMQDSLSYDRKRIQQDVSGVLERLKESGKPILLSDEGLTNARWNDRQLIARRLHDLFGSCHILATIRNQLTCIPSLYFFLVTKNVIKNIGFDEWLEKQVSKQVGTDDAWTIRQFKYAEMFRLYKDTFPDSTISFVPYELLVEDKVSFASTIARWLGVDEQVTIDTLLTAKSQNVVGSVQAMHAIRGYDRLAKTYAKLNKAWLPAFSLKKSMPALWRVKEALRDKSLQGVGARYRGTFSLTDQSKKFLTDYYSADNADLCRSIGCDLSSYGYPVSAEQTVGRLC